MFMDDGWMPGERLSILRSHAGSADASVGTHSTKDAFNRGDTPVEVLLGVTIFSLALLYS